MKMLPFCGSYTLRSTTIHPISMWPQAELQNFSSKAKTIPVQSPYLHLFLKRASFFQEWLHHFVCDWEVFGKLSALLDRSWVESVKKLISKKVIVLPDFCNILCKMSDRHINNRLLSYFFFQETFLMSSPCLKSKGLSLVSAWFFMICVFFLHFFNN